MKSLNLILLLIFALAGEIAFAQSSEYSQQEVADMSKLVSIYPNPATDHITINVVDLDASKVKLTLFNILGNEIQVETEILDNHQIRIKVKDFASGYYLIAVREDQSKFRGTYKFLKR